MSFDQELLKLKASVDQSIAAAVELASLMAAYRKALLDQGFSRAEALSMVIEYQRMMLTAAMNRNGKGES